MLKRFLALNALLLLTANSFAQCEVIKLTASDGDTDDRFGYGVALDGDRLLIPAKHNEGPMADAGSAYIFEFDGVNWIETANLMAAQAGAGDLMGWETAIQGDLIMLTAIFGNGAAVDSGTVVTFNFDGVNWIEGQTLSASNGATGTWFGRSIALDGDRVLVGASRTNGAGNNSGSVYVFERIAGVWTEMQEFVASDAASGDQFGWSVDLDGDRAVIGAWGSDTGGADSGAAYIFEYNGVSFVEVAKLTPSDAPSSRYGWALQVEGDQIAVGASEDNQMGTQAGATYMYELVGANWVETQKLTPLDIEAGDRFGVRIDIEGDRMLIGSFTSDGAANNAGAAYLYEYISGSWSRTVKLLSSDAEPGDSLGRYLDLDGDRALISATNEDTNGSNAGAAYLFRLDRGLTPYCFCTSAPTCGNDDPFAGCSTSAGPGAFLSGCGTTSHAADDLVLNVSDLPVSGFGLMFMGAGATSLPFGDGQRCVAGGGVGLYRFPVRNSGTGGSVQEGPGLVAFSVSQNPLAGQVMVGQTWNFQYWFRDQTGPCATGFNVSNALAVLFGA